MPSDAEILYKAIRIIGILFVGVLFAHILSSRIKGIPIKWSRIASQLILYIVLLTVLALPPIGLTIFISALIFLGMREGLSTARGEPVGLSASFVKICAFIAATIIPYILHFVPSMLPIYLIGMMITLFSIPVFTHEPPQALKSAVRAFMGITFSSLFSLLVLLRTEQNGLALCIVLIFLTNMTDITAYMFGGLLGKHKLVPQLSPAKTVEGAMGSLVPTLLISIWMRYEILPIYSIWQILVFAFIIGFSAHLGDLIFSVFKRAEGIKDYGRLIPGHGGILDRFDSLVIATPIFYYVVLLVR